MVLRDPERVRMAAAYLLLSIVLAGCDAKTEEVPPAGVDAQTTQHEASRRQEVTEFIASAEPLIREMKAMKIRLESGISFMEYRAKLGALADALAGLRKAPTGCAECRTLELELHEAYQIFNAAVEPWEKAMYFKRLRDAATGVERRDQLWDEYWEQDQLREARWSEATAKADGAIARWEARKPE